MLEIIKGTASYAEQTAEMFKKFLADIDEVAKETELPEFSTRPVGSSDEEEVVGEITDPYLKALVTVVDRRRANLSVTIGTLPPEEQQRAVKEMSLLTELMWAELQTAFGTDGDVGVRAGWKFVRLKNQPGGLPSVLAELVFAQVAGDDCGDPDCPVHHPETALSMA